jgi:benzoyl-CoA reductase subunit C
MPSTPVDSLLEKIRELIGEPPGQIALRWKRDHSDGRAVACFPVWAPAELIHAAGMLPLGLLGGGNTVELTHADSRFQSFVCSIAKSSLELGFQGLVKGVDGLIFSNICDVARNLASVYKRNFPDFHVDYLHLPQNSTSAAVVEYMTEELRRVAEGFSRAFGVTITDESLRRSIGLYNGLRRRLGDLRAIRIEHPQKLTTAELYEIQRSLTQAPVEESIERLDALLEGLPLREGRPKDRVRVVVEGAFCEQPPVGLIEVLEEAGCYIVEDDFLLGWRWYTADLPTTGDPFAALGDAYVNRALPSSTRHEGREHRSKGLIDKVKRSRADAVIFLPAKFCEPALFDYVPMKQGLEAAGIPHLIIEFEEKMWTFERTRTEIETFVESILFD